MKILGVINILFMIAEIDRDKEKMTLYVDFGDAEGSWIITPV